MSSGKVLVVEDDALFARALLRMLEDAGFEASHAPDVASALRRLTEKWHAVILDVFLPDGTAHQVLKRAVKMKPLPRLIALTGRANTQDAFELGRWGVSIYLEKPVVPDVLLRALLDEPKPGAGLRLAAAQLVGRHQLQEVTAHVRQVMYEQAMAVCNGDAKRAGELLGVTRQAVAKGILNAPAPKGGR